MTTTTGARQTSVSEVLGLNVLSGVVTADVVRSVASTTASGTASSYSAAGTTATNLKVLGNSVANASPGLKIPLDGNLVNRLLYGRGSYVAINDQTGSTSGPASGQNSGGMYKADLTTTMIRVYITGGTVGALLTLGGAPVEITVAKATAHSEHKQTPLCDTGVAHAGRERPRVHRVGAGRPAPVALDGRLRRDPGVGWQRQQERHRGGAAERRRGRLDDRRGGEHDGHERPDVEYGVELRPDGGGVRAEGHQRGLRRERDAHPIAGQQQRDRRGPAPPTRPARSSWTWWWPGYRSPARRRRTR